MLSFCCHGAIPGAKVQLFQGYLAFRVLLKFALCKIILNTFAYEIYQRV